MNKIFMTATLIGSIALGATVAMADNHMKKVDTDGDGMVSKTEFMAKHEEKFMKMDANSDGMLSKDEMKEARGAMKEKMKDRMEKRMDKMNAE